MQIKLTRIYINRNIHPLLVRVQICPVTMETNTEVPQKIQPIHLKTQVYHSWAYKQKIIYPTKNDTCSTMLITVLFIIARNYKEPRFPLTEKWIKKMWYIFTMENY